jgi:AraC-like DNA-binding protein
VDVLSDVLQMARMQQTFVARVRASAPWALRMGGGNKAFFHAILSGTCTLVLESSGETHTLGTGDIVLLPRGDVHTVSTPGAGAPMDLVGQVGISPGACPGFSFGGGGEEVLAVTGVFEFDTPDDAPLARMLPPLVLVRGRSPEAVQWVESTFRFLTSEFSGDTPGTEVVLQRLADLVFLQTVRAYLHASGPKSQGWLGALADPQVGQALRLLHEAPSRRWSVEELAEAAGLSRSRFAERFRQGVGESPMEYLSRLRMRKAAALLRGGRPKLLEVAQQTGYESESAFSTAFKRWAGVSPGDYRQRHAQPGQRAP